ncbi:MAG: alpha/beta hydrolase fold domain-containing protein [Gemmatimonadaceae bacterium]
MEIAPGVSAITNIAYATRSPTQKLDLYLPTSGPKPYPVVLWLHAGGWHSGDKALGPNAVHHQLVSQGFALVSANYRLSGEAKWPAQIQDVKAVVRWIRANAGAYPLNANRIGAWGLSAGGHLAAMLGTSSGVASLTDLSLGNPTMSDYVKSVVDWAGPQHFLALDSQLALNGCPLYGGSGHNAASSPEGVLMGAPIQTIPSRVLAASPRTYVGAGDATFLIQHGMLDCTIPYQQATGLAQRIRTVLGAAQVQLELFPNARHGGPDYTGPANMTRVINYLKATL